jgi:hypothetical protein
MKTLLEAVGTVGIVLYQVLAFRGYVYWVSSFDSGIWQAMMILVGIYSLIITLVFAFKEEKEEQL